MIFSLLFLELFIFSGLPFPFLAKLFSGNSLFLLQITMSSQADSSLSTPEALLPMDDRLVVVSASEESSGHESVGVQEAEPASVTVGSSEDDYPMSEPSP